MREEMHSIADGLHALAYKPGPLKYQRRLRVQLEKLRRTLEVSGIEEVRGWKVE